MSRHVAPEEKSDWATERDRPNILKPFNVFATQEDIDGLNRMAKELGYPSRAELFRTWIRQKLANHERARKAASK
jgi:hypothetical protein